MTRLSLQRALTLAIACTLLLPACAEYSAQAGENKHGIDIELHAWTMSERELEELEQGGLLSRTDALSDLVEYAPPVAGLGEQAGHVSQGLIMAAPVVVVAAGLTGGGLLVLAPKLSPASPRVRPEDGVDFARSIGRWWCSIHVSAQLLLSTLSPAVERRHEALDVFQSEAQALEDERATGERSRGAEVLDIAAFSLAHSDAEARCEAMTDAEGTNSTTSVRCGPDRHCATVDVCIQGGQLVYSPHEIVTVFVDDEADLANVHIDVRLLPTSDESLWIVLEDVFDLEGWDNEQVTVPVGHQTTIVHHKSRFELELGLLPLSQRRAGPEHKLLSMRDAP